MVQYHQLYFNMCVARSLILGSSEFQVKSVLMTVLPPNINASFKKISMKKKIRIAFIVMSITSTSNLFLF